MHNIWILVSSKSSLPTILKLAEGNCAHFRRQLAFRSKNADCSSSVSRNAFLRIHSFKKRFFANSSVSRNEFLRIHQFEETHFCEFTVSRNDFLRIHQFQETNFCEFISFKKRIFASPVSFSIKKRQLEFISFKKHIFASSNARVTKIKLLTALVEKNQRYGLALFTKARQQSIDLLIF